MIVLPKGRRVYRSNDFSEGHYKLPKIQSMCDLDRVQLSGESGWLNTDGKLYVEYTTMLYNTQIDAVFSLKHRKALNSKYAKDFNMDPVNRAMIAIADACKCRMFLVFHNEEDETRRAILPMSFHEVMSSGSLQFAADLKSDTTKDWMIAWQKLGLLKEPYPSLEEDEEQEKW